MREAIEEARAAALAGDVPVGAIVVDAEYVRQQVAGIVKSQDLSRYIL